VSASSALTKEERNFIERYEMAQFLLEGDNLKRLCQLYLDDDTGSLGDIHHVALEEELNHFQTAKNLDLAELIADQQSLLQLATSKKTDFKKLFTQTQKQKLSKDDILDTLKSSQTTIHTLEAELDHKITRLAICGPDDPQHTWLKAEVIKIQEKLNDAQQQFNTANTLNAFFKDMATARTKQLKQISDVTSISLDDIEITLGSSNTLNPFNNKLSLDPERWTPQDYRQSQAKHPFNNPFKK